MKNTPTTSTDLPGASGAIPSHLAEQLEGAIPRSYLLNKIESIVASLSANQKRGVAVCLVTGLCLKSRKSLLDRVSTGSGSDLVGDRHAIFAKDLDPDGWTRSLPLPALTRSKCDSYF